MSFRGLVFVVALAIIGALIVPHGPRPRPHGSTARIMMGPSESDAHAWQAVGPSAEILDATYGFQDLVPGGSLRFVYNVGDEDRNILVHPVPVGSLARVRSIRLSVLSDSATSLAFTLVHSDGVMYDAICWVPQDKWQNIELGENDFILDQNAFDPHHPDLKVKMDRVASFAITDYAQEIANVNDPDRRGMIKRSLGSHVLEIKDFVASEEPVPKTVTTYGKEVVIDTFEHPELDWFGGPISGFVRMPEGNLPGGVDLTYQQIPGEPMMICRSLPPGAFANTRTLSFDVLTRRRTRLAVTLTDGDFTMFAAQRTIDGSQTPLHIDVPFSAFVPLDDEKQVKLRLDAGKLAGLMFMDLSGLTARKVTENELWISHLVARP